MYEIFNIPLPEPKVLTLEEFYNSMQNQKYHGHYERLINRAKDRVLEGYSEKHHIIPRCLGGLDSEENYARLTGEEHYIAHLLLCKIYPNKAKLVYAANMMTLKANGLRIGNKRYSWLRKKLAIEVGNRFRGLTLSEVHRNKISLGNMGRIMKPESILKSSISRTGAKRSDEARANIGAESKRPDRVAALIARNKSYIGREVSQETRDKIRIGNVGKKMPPKSEEALLSFRAKMKGRKRPPRSEEWCKNMSIASKNRPPVSEETKSKISASLMGHETTDACREKLSKLNKGKKIKEPRSDQWRKLMFIAKTGGKASEETKAKMAESQRLRWDRKKLEKFMSEGIYYV